MSKRIWTGIIGIPVLAAVIILGGPVLYAAISLVASMALYEYVKSVNGNYDISMNFWLEILLGLLMLAAFYFDAQWVFGLLVLSVALLVGRDVFKGNVNIFNTVFGVYGLLYIPFFLGHLLLLDQMDHGNMLIWLIFIISFGTDTFAYFVGMRFGKHRLSPTISPKKSVEGSVGGVVAAVLLTMVFGYFFEASSGVGLSLAKYGIIAFVASLVSQLGDLAASMIKRQFGIKDFGNLLPGHGGMLDRFDSVIFAAPAIYYMIMALI
ncbi:phosphatidate cytidylyltransferase [Alkalibacter rhizosphaerae]|uniref:Phosphatidate cytidylyltransferase n=1 Tax=Alkalibacter rhizosphaerae TaxID=2815577 RepID=A0A974XF44_9FIRM|nr:phosphatidate cytidylyltransferase [Alkalibacter rhizosphaerae]QSX08702.1 phosphatidate cytidylyltransferase [Alkalibacter rhizosphaerae]